MTSHLHLMSPEHAMKLVAQRQAELAAQFEKASGERVSHSRFVRMFRVRRFLARLVPRFAAQI